MKSTPTYVVRERIILWLLVVGFCLFMACGRKGPPIPPRYVAPPAVSDLQYQISGETVTLTWTISETGMKPTYAVSGSNVYRLKTPLDSDVCPECPLVFTFVKKYPLKSGTAQHRETLERGFRYTYKIVIIDEANKEGPDSNLVQFAIE